MIQWVRLKYTYYIRLNKQEPVVERDLERRKVLAGGGNEEKGLTGGGYTFVINLYVIVECNELWSDVLYCFDAPENKINKYFGY